MGRFEGTEEEFEAEPPGEGPPCFEVTRSTFVLHAAGPIRLRIEATDIYYFAPEGTYRARLDDGRGDPDAFGQDGPVPATVTLFADGMVDPDGGSCRGTGHFWRGTSEDRTVFHAEWAWDHDCEALGDGDRGSDAGIVPAGTRHVLSGTYEPCFDPPCHDNIRGALVQRADPVDDDSRRA